jgi:hypothetical protein
MKGKGILRELQNEELRNLRSAPFAKVKRGLIRIG